MSDSTVSIARPVLAAAGGAGATLATIALIVLALAFHLFAPLGPDVSWLITVSERMLDGQTLYTDIMEPNPPMAGLLYILPVLVARLVGLPSEMPVIIYTLAFGLAVVSFATGIVRSAELATRPDLFALLALLLAVVAWGEDFAQREHFAAMAALPILACIAARAEGRGLPIHQWLVAGLCGALVLAIKPHFALAILLPTLYAVARRRSFFPLIVPELWVAGLGFVAFVGMTWVWFPAFFSEILPVANAVYVPDRRGVSHLLLVPPATRLFAFTLLLAIVVLLRTIFANNLHATLFAASLGFAAVYMLQAKGFPYHIAPAQVMLGVALLGAVLERGMRTGSRGDVLLVIVGAICLASLPIANAVNVRQVWSAQAQILRPYGEGLRIANVSTDLALTSPLHRMVKGELVNSAPSLLMTLSAYRVRRDHNPDAKWLAQIEAAENSEMRRLHRDFQLRRPDILVTTMDVFDLASRDPVLAGAMDGYRAIGSLDVNGVSVRYLAREGLEPILH